MTQQSRTQAPPAQPDVLPAPAPKRGPGRPLKGTDTAPAPSVKRGPGRPRKNPIASKYVPKQQKTKSTRPTTLSSAPAPGLPEMATAVRSYLVSLQNPQPRGRKVDPETLRSRRDATVDPMQRLLLTQKLIDATAASGFSRAQLEEAFIRHAAAFAAQQNVSWAAWRFMGVPSAVLRRAGIHE